MKKVFVSCSPEDASKAYAAIVRRGALPLDSSPILAALPSGIDENVKTNLVLETIAGADEVWVVGEETPEAAVQAAISGAEKPVKTVLFESEPAPVPAATVPSEAPKFSVVVLYKDPARTAENFSCVFSNEEDAHQCLTETLQNLSSAAPDSTMKIADDKLSGYIAQERKLVCSVYILPIF